MCLNTWSPVGDYGTFERFSYIRGSMSLGEKGGCDIPALLPRPLCAHKRDQPSSCSMSSPPSQTLPLWNSS